IPHAASKVSPYVTVSMGIATITSDRESDVSELIRLADRALYSAKAGGRNQVVQAEAVEPAEGKSELNHDNRSEAVSSES
ncbi:diguanylate cyclase, partial [Oceanospirillum sp. HFRX-1_2]